MCAHGFPAGSILLLVACCANSALNEALSEEQLRERFLREAPSAWERLDDMVSARTHTMKRQTLRLTPNDVPRHRLLEWKQVGAKVVARYGGFVSASVATQRPAKSRWHAQTMIMDSASPARCRTESGSLWN
jgi:hypothetical protein